MGKIRRGGFVFVSWKGDHTPRHVHVYRGGELVLKWDLENRRLMEGVPTLRVLKLILSLERERRL